MVPSVDSMTGEDSQAESGSLGDKLKVGMKRKISLTNCGVCGSVEAKYKCPGCLKHSCSLPCVRKHKEDSGCSGVRDKTAFVALSQFDEMNLLSDYRFLEDTGRMADSANRDKLVRAPTVTSRVKTLTTQARRMNITLRFLPVTFTKSRENSTIFVNKGKRFLWHLKLLFPQSESEFVEKRISDDRTLEQILTPYIHPTESEPVRRQKLKIYVRSPFSHVKVFMRAEGRKANSVRYQELDLTKSLRDNLRYKTVLEYPVLHVVLLERCQDYPLKGPAGAAASSSGPAPGRTGSGVGPGEGAAGVPPPHRGPDVLGGTLNRSPQTGPPKEKRAKRDPADEELEDGEVRDTEDDDDDEDRGDGAVRVSEAAGDVKTTEECPGESGPQADSVVHALGQCLISSGSNVFNDGCSVDGGFKGDGEMTEVQGPVDDNTNHVVRACE